MNGSEVVSYTYDSWGTPLSCTGSLASTLGAVNPLRYRGYIWDAETGLYYLQSRYYNPEWGRFVNADNIIGGVGGISEHNVFVYCLNNPVNCSDSNGLLAASAVSTAIDYLFPGSSQRAQSVMDNPSFYNIGNWLTMGAFADAVTVATAEPFSNDHIVASALLVANFVPGGKAAAPAKNIVIGKITGYTKHGINQAISRNGVGVKPAAILAAVKNGRPIIDEVREVVKYAGKQSVVVANYAGKIVTAYAKSSKYVRIK